MKRQFPIKSQFLQLFQMMIVAGKLKKFYFLDAIIVMNVIDNILGNSLINISNSFQDTNSKCIGSIS